MTPSEYKQAQRDLGFYGRNKLAGWLDALGISDPTHKRYTTGKSAVSPTVERLIKSLLRIQQQGNEMAERQATPQGMRPMPGDKNQLASYLETLAQSIRAGEYPICHSFYSTEDRDVETMEDPEAPGTVLKRPGGGGGIKLLLELRKLP